MTAPEAPRFSEAQIRAWMTRVRVLCDGWRTHPDFDDILASAYEHMWQALQSAEQGYTDHTGLALAGAWKGVHRFLRSPMNRRRKRTQRGNALAELVSLSDWISLWSEEEMGQIPPPASPDFAPSLIDWLVALDEWRALPPLKREALWLGCVLGLTRKEIMERMGLPRDVGYRLLSGLWVLGYAHPGPVRINKERSRAAHPRPAGGCAAAHP